MRIFKHMKKTISFALLIAIGTMGLFAQTSEIQVKGKIDGIKKGRLYLLARASETEIDTLGFCDFKRGKFNLEATASEPLMTQIVVEGFSGGFAFFAEPGVSYEALLSEKENFYIRGGQLNDAYTAHMKTSASMQARIADLQQRYDALRAERKFRGASLVNDTLRIEQEKLRGLTTAFLDCNDNIIKAYTYCSNIEMRDANLRETRSLYADLSDAAKSSQYGRIIKERIARLAKTEGGAKAPDFTLPDVQGNMVTMSSVKAKIKIVDFWASWCGPCRLNNPALRKIYDEFHAKGLEIIGVSLDTNKASWEKAIEKDGLNWINVSSLKGWKCDLVRQYNVTGVPSIFILDEHNNILATGLKGEQLRQFLLENL